MASFFYVPAVGFKFTHKSRRAARAFVVRIRNKLIEYIYDRLGTPIGGDSGLDR